MKSTFYIRLSHKTADVIDKIADTYLTNPTNDLLAYNEEQNNTYLGMLDSFHRGKWKLIYEKDYSFYMDEELLLPFICEYNKSKCVDDQI